MILFFKILNINYFRVQNLLKSLPNDDDLFEIYREEREINGAVFEERRRERLKQVFFFVIYYY